MSDKSEGLQKIVFAKTAEMIAEMARYAREGDHFDAVAVVKEIRTNEIAAIVLAACVDPHDGRYSAQNKAWAEQYARLWPWTCPPPALSGIHACIKNAMVTAWRQTP